MSDFEHLTAKSRDGVEIAYVTMGEGQPIVIVPGGFAVAEEWFATARLLARTRRVVVVERRGRGRSGDAERHDLSTEIDDLEEVIWQIGPDVDLLGHSYGGALVLGYALRTGFPGRAILYEAVTSIPGKVGGEKVVPVRALFDDGRPEDALELLYSRVLRMSPEQIAALRASSAWDHHLRHLQSFLREIDALDQFAPSVQELGEINARVAVLLGTESDDWTRDNAAALVRGVSGVTLLPVNGHSHFAHMSDPELMAQVTEQALDLLRP